MGKWIAVIVVVLVLAVPFVVVPRSADALAHTDRFESTAVFGPRFTIESGFGMFIIADGKTGEIFSVIGGQLKSLNRPE